jgi:hypothetical protein
MDIRKENTYRRKGAQDPYMHPIPLLPLAKVIPLLGGGLPGNNPPVPAAPVIPTPIGSLTPWPIVVNSSTVWDLSLGNLEYFSIFYNDTFGILEGDDIGERRAKFVRWLSW